MSDGEAAVAPPVSGATKRRIDIEKPRLPLVLKLFGLTALLIATVVAIAVGITVQRASSIAHETVGASISGAARLFREFESQRLARLALPTQLLGNDPAFVALIQADLAGGGEAATGPSGRASQPAVNLVSIADQLEQRRQSFGTDLLLLLDDQGRLVARTDQPAATAPPLDDFYEHSTLVRRIVDDASIESTTGVLATNGKLYHAAVAPVGIGTPRLRIAYLVNAVAIDEVFANRIAESTNAGVVFVPRAWKEVAARSENAPAVDVVRMKGAERILATGKPVPPSDLTIDNSDYVMTGEPLLSGSEIVGAAIFLRSLDRELAPFRQIRNSMLIGGGIALLLAFVLSWLLAKRVTRPIEQLAGIAQAVTAGDYSVHPEMERRDEVGILARAFGKMINSLRDKEEIEELYAGMMRGGGSSPTVKLHGTGSIIAAGQSAELQPGHFFAGRYRIEQVIGRGGMGVVYRAVDTNLEETVAIKTLPGDVMTRSPEDLERFKREIRLARKITHRNVLRTFDYGEAEGAYFISMEFVRGYTLADLLQETPDRRMPPRAAVGVARQICRGLQAAHEQGIIHRDIKPQNVLIDAHGEVKLMDFGIARMAEAGDAMTQAGLIVGTPHYMSPEQVQGKQLDARSDVYSAGVLIYEMLVGRRPFESPSLTAILAAHVTDVPAAPADVRSDIGSPMSAIVMRCLEKRPELRYADAGALLADLDSMQLPSAA